MGKVEENVEKGRKVELGPWEEGSRGPCVGITSELLATVGCWGSPLDLCPAHIGLFQEMVMSEWHFINGANRVRLVERNISYREQFLHFGSDVGLYWNSDPEWMEYRRAAVDRHCWHNHEPVPRGAQISPGVLTVPPSVTRLPLNSSRCDGFLPCRDPAEGQQELLGYVVATDLVPNGGWTQQLLVLLETLCNEGSSPPTTSAWTVSQISVSGNSPLLDTVSGTSRLNPAPRQAGATRRAPTLVFRDRLERLSLKVLDS
uniref:MHC class II beta chain N-terminal domain-containing protein n=1 Tax=Ficedula albicollis TaxID=59894 RepID=A0A803W3C7_FICAL